MKLLIYIYIYIYIHTNIVIKNVKLCVICKISNYIKIFLILKIISENSRHSYVIVELLYITLGWLAASKVGVELVFSRVDVGVLIG